MADRKRALDVGVGQSEMAVQLWPDAEIVTLDVNPNSGADIVCDLESEAFLTLDMGLFDYIVASHVLEHLRLRFVPRVIARLAALLADGGELHILVPSLDWAAEQIISGKPSPVTLFHIYGSQADDWQFHRAGFSLTDLRAQLRKAGLTVRAAGRGEYTIVLEGHTFHPEHLYVMAVKEKDQ